jgi:serralysin
MPAVETYNPTGNAYIDAVLGTIKWVPSNLTYSFPTAATSYGSSYGDGEAARRREDLARSTAHSNPLRARH